MANKTFVSNGTFTVADNDAVAFGASVAGTEIVKIQSGVTGVKLDANFEQIVLSSALSTYKFLVVSGTGLQILATDGTTVIATIPNLNQVVKLVFADGFTTLTQTGSTAFELGVSSTVSTSTAGALTPTLSTGYTVSEFASAAGGIAVSENIIVSDTASAISTDLALGANSVLLNNMAKIDAFTLSDSGSVTASSLKTIDAATTSLVDASSITAITALAAADYALVGGASATGNAVKTKAGVNIDIAATTTMTATALKAIDANTTGIVDASLVDAITGLAAADYTIIGGTTVSGTNAILKTKAGVNIDIAATTTMTATALKAIDANTTGIVDASLVDAITGLAAADYTIIGGTTVSGTNAILKTKTDVNITLTDTATFEQLVTLDSKTSGTITTTTANITATSGDSVVGYTEVGTDGFGNLDTFAIEASATLTASTAGMGASSDAFSFSGTGTMVYQATAAATVADNEYMLVRGTWSGGIFTADSSTGTSTLVLFDSDTSSAAATSAVVLIGVSPSTITNASDGFSIT